MNKRNKIKGLEELIPHAIKENKNAYKLLEAAINKRYEIKLSEVNEFNGLIVQEVGLGTLLIIPEKPTQKSINPTHTAHQSSDFIRMVKTDFKEIYITNITTVY